MDGDKVTVYLRFPFERNGFKDPPVSEWNTTKERNLWEHLSRSLNKAEIDWNQLADQFSVSVPFILQQAAWLYEKELEQVRAQMQKVHMHSKRKQTTVQEEQQPLSPGNDHKQQSVSRQASNSSIKTWSAKSSSDSSSFFGGSGENYEETSRQLLSKSRMLSKPAAGDDLNDSDPDFLPLAHRDTEDSGTTSKASAGNSEDKNPGASDTTTGTTTNNGVTLTAGATTGTNTTTAASGSSSFTDLSEASITKSALEEALYDIEPSMRAGHQ